MKMSNEKFYLCGNKICFTSYKCPTGKLLIGAPDRLYATKEDYIAGNDNCITSLRIKETGEEIRFQGKLEYTEECTVDNEL